MVRVGEKIEKPFDRISFSTSSPEISVGYRYRHVSVRLRMRGTGAATPATSGNVNSLENVPLNAQSDQWKK